MPDVGTVYQCHAVPMSTPPAVTGGFLTGGTTYYYRITGLTTRDNSTTVSGAVPNLSGGPLNVVSTGGFDPSGVLTVGVLSVTCSYTITSLTAFHVTGCAGVPTGGAPVTSANESLPGPEGSYKVPGTAAITHIPPN